MGSSKLNLLYLALKSIDESDCHVSSKLRSNPLALNFSGKYGVSKVHCSEVRTFIYLSFFVWSLSMTTSIFRYMCGSFGKLSVSKLTLNVAL